MTFPGQKTRDSTKAPVCTREVCFIYKGTNIREFLCSLEQQQRSRKTSQSSSLEIGLIFGTQSSAMGILEKSRQVKPGLEKQQALNSRQWNIINPVPDSGRGQFREAPCFSTTNKTCLPRGLNWGLPLRRGKLCEALYQHGFANPGTRCRCP